MVDIILDNGVGNMKALLIPAESAKRSEPAGGEIKSGQEKKLRRACADFEALFIYQLFQAMRKTIPESGLTNKMTGKETYAMMMDQKIAEDLAQKNGLGLQKTLFDQLNRGRQGLA